MARRWPEDCSLEYEPKPWASLVLSHCKRRDAVWTLRHGHPTLIPSGHLESQASYHFTQLSGGPHLTAGPPWLHRQPGPRPLGHVAVYVLWGIHNSQAEKQARAAGQDLAVPEYSGIDPASIFICGPERLVNKLGTPCQAPRWVGCVLFAPQHMRARSITGRRVWFRKPD